jgi:hypothetical protein
MYYRFRKGLQRRIFMELWARSDGQHQVHARDRSSLYGLSPVTHMNCCIKPSMNIASLTKALRIIAP